MAAIAASKPRTDDAELIRLVGRITYGANEATLNQARSLGYEGFLDWQLDYQSIDDSQFESLLVSRFTTLDDEISELIPQLREDRFKAAKELIIATLARRWYSPRQLHERMVEFWSDHFNIYIGNGVLSILKPVEDREVIRPHALGRFSELLLADAKSPAMLYYLDNVSNTKAGPNENYAREVMELHTVGVDGGYNEQDVAEAARCFTGWTIRRPPRVGFVFNPFNHDFASKQVMDLYLPPGGGVTDGETLLNHLASHPATATHIATKLCRHFVSDAPSEQLVEDTARVFSQTDGDIKQTLRALLLNPAVRQAPPLKLKRPNDFVGAQLRALEVSGQAIPKKSLRGAFKAMGHTPFRWPAPNGYPDVRGYWQSTTGFLTRFNLAFTWASQLENQSPVLRGAQDLKRRPARLVDYLQSALLPAGLSDKSRRTLIQYALSLNVDERVAAIAGQMMAGPEAQWY